MGTFSQISIKCNDLDVVVALLEEFFTIGRKEVLSESKWWYYFTPKRSETIVVTQNYNNEWVELDVEGGRIYSYDDFLKMASERLKTIILLGYYQSTSCHGRIAVFEEGSLKISYYEEPEEDPTGNGSIVVAENFGVQDSSLDILKNSKLGDYHSKIDRDFIYSFFRSKGWNSNLKKDYFDWTYLHLEKLIQS